MNRIFIIVLKGLLLIQFIGLNLIYAQQNSDVQIQIVDASSGTPISYATVRFKGTNQGVIADYDGEFRLPDNLYKASTTLVISCIGFKTKEIGALSLSRDKKNLIKLDIQIEALDVVVIESKRIRSTNELENLVRPLTARDIVRKAINAITTRLDSGPHSYIGYYRDYQIVDNQYFNLNEAILEIFDKGIYSDKLDDRSNLSALYFYQSNSDFLQDNALTIPYQSGGKYIRSANVPAYGGNELTMLKAHDPVRNYKLKTFSFVYTFYRDFLNNHVVRKGEVLYFGNAPIIKIPFQASPEITQNKFSAKGELYISLDDYSIYRFSYNCFDRDQTNPLYSVSLEYKKQDEKMYLNYITFNNRFSVADKNTLREVDIEFNPSNSTIEISFNKPIDERSLKRSAFRIEYKGRKLIVNSYTMLDPTKVIVELVPFENDKAQLNQIRQEDFKIKLRRIKDLSGKRIYQRQNLICYQFRELFVQEILPDTRIEPSIIPVDSRRPLKWSTVNDNDNYQQYWINTPLKSTRQD